MVVAGRVGRPTQRILVRPADGRQVRHLGVAHRRVHHRHHGEDGHALARRDRPYRTHRRVRVRTDGRLSRQRIRPLNQPRIRLRRHCARWQRVRQHHVHRIRRPRVADEDLVVDRVVLAHPADHGEVGQVLLQHMQLRFRRHVQHDLVEHRRRIVRSHRRTVDQRVQRRHCRAIPRRRIHHHRRHDDDPSTRRDVRQVAVPGRIRALPAQRHIAKVVVEDVEVDDLSIQQQRRNHLVRQLWMHRRHIPRVRDPDLEAERRAGHWQRNRVAHRELVEPVRHLVDRQRRPAVHLRQPHRLIQLRAVIRADAVHLRLVEDHSVPFHRAQIRRRSCNDL